ncbi:MAG: spore germination protein [Thermacetogeniaceae bacterium]
MFQWLRNLFGHRKGAARKPYQVEPEQEDRLLSKKLDDNKQVLSEIFDHCEDLVTREIIIGKQGNTRALAVFLDSLVSLEVLEESLLEPLQTVQAPPSVTIEWLMEEAIPNARVLLYNRWVDVAGEITKGLVAFFVEGQDRALLLYAPENVDRPVMMPQTESVARGSLDAFNENGRLNVALVRKRLHTTRLAVEKVDVGEVSKFKIAIIYLKGYVYEGLVEELKARLSRIRIDGILGSGQIEELIQDAPYSMVSGIGVTERPDRVASALLQGKAALLFDNDPFALIVPTTLISDMQSPEDYYNRYWFASFIRLVRWGSLLVALLAPALYVAITTFHQDLIPTNLLGSLLSARSGVPFPGMVEALLMVLAFEILLEAGIRLPKAFGQTIGVVGAILIGQVAVTAGLVSPVVVMTIALTAIASYTLPSLGVSTGLRLLRFVMIIAAGCLGLFGVMAVFIMVTFQLCALRSFGVPYLSPFAPLSLGDLKDTFVRAPIWAMRMRPRLQGYVEPVKQDSNKPRSPKPR